MKMGSTSMPRHLPLGVQCHSFSPSIRRSRRLSTSWLLRPHAQVSQQIAPGIPPSRLGSVSGSTSDVRPEAGTETASECGVTVKAAHRSTPETEAPALCHDIS